MRGERPKQDIRILYIVDDISMESYAIFSRELAELQSISNETIDIELASHGGDAYAALAYAARIRLSTCDIRITAVGFVASAAVLILAAGDKRFMTEESWVMVHEDAGELEGDVTSLEREAAQMRKLENQWNSLLEKYTKVSAADWATFHKQTTYLTPISCRNLGLIDEIL